MKNKGNNKIFTGFAFGIVIVFLLFALFVSSAFGAFSKGMTGFVIGGESFLSNIIIPSTIASIVFSLVALATIMFLIYRVRHKGVNFSFPFRAYIAAVVMVFVIYAINYFITLFPYGNLSFIIITFILQIMIYGILLPYVLLAHISYIVLLLNGDVKEIFK